MYVVESLCSKRANLWRKQIIGDSINLNKLENSINVAKLRHLMILIWKILLLMVESMVWMLLFSLFGAHLKYVEKW